MLIKYENKNNHFFLTSFFDLTWLAKIIGRNSIFPSNSDFTEIPYYVINYLIQNYVFYMRPLNAQQYLKNKKQDKDIWVYYNESKFY